jgi:2-oxo-4-hydroxy-4-carboxy--5-ureidoimidazoline (OHCU) decarboxylase
MVGADNLEREMTKTQQRDARMARLACLQRMPDMAARILSAAHRAAMRQSDKREIEALARELGITGQRDWVICG